MANIFKKLKPKRRWLQFSMRTVLVLVTLFCLALSLWAVPAERKRRAVVAIENVGGLVFYVGEQTVSGSFPKSLLTLRRWLPRVYFDEVIEVDLMHCTEITDADLVHLQDLAGLQDLWLTDTPVTDAGLDHLQGLTGLQLLQLDGTQVTSKGLNRLQGLNSLQSLHLYGTKVTDAGLAHLKRLTSLQVLDLRGTQVTDDGLAELRNALPTCDVSGP